MKLLSWQEFNTILISNSVNRINPKKDEQLFLQHYESYFSETDFGTGRAVNIEIQKHVNYSSIDVKLKNDVLIPNEYTTSVLALYLCINGNIKVDFCNDNLSGGQFGFFSVPPGTYNFQFYGTQENQYQVIGVHFTHESFRDYLGDSFYLLPTDIIECINHQIPFGKVGNYKPDLHNRILQLANGKFDKLHDRLILEGMIYEIMSYVVENFDQKKAKVSSIHYKTMSDFCKLISSNPFSPLALSEIPSKFGMSESSFYKVFKSLYGISPKQFILDKKLIAAKKILESESISVKEVAFRSGYESISSFSRVFKKRFGLRPGEVIRERT
ncbi:MAG: AraC family transcriptional regulator [Crocinitomicaceae bacterium]